MMRKLSTLLVVWFLSIAPARAATPLDYTRTILRSGAYDSWRHQNQLDHTLNCRLCGEIQRHRRVPPVLTP